MENITAFHYIGLIAGAAFSFWIAWMAWFKNTLVVKGPNIVTKNRSLAMLFALLGLLSGTSLILLVLMLLALKIMGVY